MGDRALLVYTPRPLPGSGVSEIRRPNPPPEPPHLHVPGPGMQRAPKPSPLVPPDPVMLERAPSAALWATLWVFVVMAIGLAIAFCGAHR